MKRAEAIFAQAVSDLDARCHVKISDLTAGEILRLVAACDRVANPFREVNADAAGIPVRVAKGVYFWHLTIGASVWLDECERFLDEDRYRLALIYAVGNARNASAFDGLDDERSVCRAVKRYCRSIAATPQEVNLALDILFRRKADTRQSDVTDAAADWVNICARLETQTGIPAKDWIWNHSGRYALKCFNDLSEFASAYSGGDARVRAHMKDELCEAQNELQRLKAEIMRRVYG